MGTTQVIHPCFCKFHIWALIIQAGMPSHICINSPTSNGIKKTAPKSYFAHRGNFQQLFPATWHYITLTHHAHHSSLSHSGEMQKWQWAIKTQFCDWQGGRKDQHRAAAFGRTIPLSPDWNQLPPEVHFLAITLSQNRFHCSVTNDSGIQTTSLVEISYLRTQHKVFLGPLPALGEEDRVGDARNERQQVPKTQGSCWQQLLHSYQYLKNSAAHIPTSWWPDFITEWANSHFFLKK